ncbi:hypothetical protein HW132_35115 [Brasilonema sp. CT11]|nr:hypothetical protein [Brasilonema sp. CT11]
MEAFKLLGVTMYWPSEVDMPEEQDDEDDEDDENDGEYVACAADEENEAEEADENASEDEEDALNKTNDEAENEDEVKESKFTIDSIAFRRIADAVVEPQEEEDDEDNENDEEDGGEQEDEDDEEDDGEWAIQESALDAMQASAEEFTSQLVSSALNMVQLYKRDEISAADLKFVLTLWQNTPGGSDIMKRIRI